MLAGVNELPMQSFCRSTTVPVAGDWQEILLIKNEVLEQSSMKKI